MPDYFAKIREFIASTMTELRKCSWPTRDELFESTILVIISMGILSLFVAGVDLLSRRLINFLTM